MSTLNWAQLQDGSCNSQCGSFFISRCGGLFGGGLYYKLSWMGHYGQTCQKDFNSLGDAKRSAAMRQRRAEVDE